MKYKIVTKNRTFVEVGEGSEATVVAVNTRGCKPMTPETAEAIAALVTAVREMHAAKTAARSPSEESPVK